MFKKRFLGIPIAVIIGVVLIATLGAGTALGAFIFHQQNTASLTILGSEIKAYKDAGLIQPLLATDILDFGSAWLSDGVAVSNHVTIYLKNTGDDSQFPYLGVSSLASPMTLSDTTFGVIGVKTPLFPLPATQGINGALTAITASDTTMTLNGASSTPATSGYIKTPEGEWIHYASWTSPSSGVINLAGCIRGQLGTTAQASAGGNTIFYNNGVNGILAGAVVPLDLTVNVPANTPRQNTSFTISLDSTSQH